MQVRLDPLDQELMHFWSKGWAIRKMVLLVQMTVKFFRGFDRKVENKI